MNSKSEQSPPEEKPPQTRLVVVSNRLPVALERSGGSWKVNIGGGGLVRALAPVLRARGGMWMGWAGTSEDVDLNKLLTDSGRDVGYQYRTVALTREEVDGFYNGFSNQIIWPLFHDLQTRCTFAPEFWNAYKRVNAKFAKAVEKHTGAADYIWIHDYHLMHLARMLRQAGIKRRSGFFLHIPFPSPDIFMKLPWRARVLQALLEYDLIGFQTARDRRNFLSCLGLLLPDVKLTGRGAVLTAEVDHRQVRIGSFPISIDFDNFAKPAASATVTAKVGWLKKGMLGSRIVLGVDRLDYTKGVPERLLSFQNALERYSDLHGNLTMVQLIVPSREEIAEYKTLKSDVERLVGEINGRFTRAGWVPIHYLYRNMEYEELLAYYRAADIALVTPFKDGMNLIAKEYCAANVEEGGVLILSEFAGAAAQLQKDALLVNPYDIEGVADAIHQAFAMGEEERRGRMRRLRESVRRNDLYRWVESYLQAAFSIHLEESEMVEEYAPQILFEMDGSG
jgi:trehalose 6-phosphate synthase